MERQARSRLGVVCAGNAWHFDSEDQLLRGFFATLAEALGKSLPTKKEELGRLPHRYGGLLALATVSIGRAVKIGAGEAAKGLGEALREHNLRSGLGWPLGARAAGLNRSILSSVLPLWYSAGRHRGSRSHRAP